MRALAVMLLVSATADAKPPTNADVVKLAGRLATALDHDVPLGDLVDPQDGVHVWWPPGSEDIEMTQLHATDTPTTRFAKTEMTPWYQANYGKQAAIALRYALAHLDIAPKQPDAAQYAVDCTRHDVQAPRAMLAGFVLERRGDVKVTFVTRGDKLYVASVHVEMPCML
jgi:hypothetical protein